MVATIMAAVPLSVSAAADTALVGSGSGSGILNTQGETSINGVVEEATGLYINGTLIGAIKNSSDLDVMLKSILETYNEPGATVSFVEKVETVQGLYATTNIFSTETFRDILQGNGSNTPLSYTVQEGDTLESITEKFHTDEASLEDINGGALSLDVGTTIHIINNEALVNVKMVKNDVYTASIPYATIMVPDATQYTTHEEVTIEGQEGSQTCLDQVTYINGVETERTNVNRVVVAPAVNEVAIVGTITPPDGSIPGEASGTFTWPVPSITKISSGFGSRWGTTHQGLDISNGNSYGQTIVAADAGVVSYVKKSNVGYGYHLEIDHGNGTTTLYAHTSEILVQPGEKVFKGQPIALVGSTGDSTGAHLHFEIHKNGVAVNPLEYVTVGS